LGATRYSSHFAAGVTGILIDNGIELDESFVCPLRREFPAGFNCFVSDDVICAPQWGAASLTAKARDSFVARYSPNVSQQWK
jgi:hypothetical protein